MPGLARVPGRVRREHFRHVGVVPARQSRLEQRRGFPQQQVGRFGLGMGARDRELYSWFCPIGRSNTIRCFAYATAVFVNQRASPIASDDTSIRSALMPSRIYRKPCPLADQILCRHARAVGRNTSVALWLTIAFSGLISRPLPRQAPISNKNTDRPSVFFFTWSSGVCARAAA